MKKFKNSRLSTDSRKLQTLALNYLRNLKRPIKHWTEFIERYCKVTVIINLHYDYIDATDLRLSMLSTCCEFSSLVFKKFSFNHFAIGKAFVSLIKAFVCDLYWGFVTKV